MLPRAVRVNRPDVPQWCQCCQAVLADGLVARGQHTQLLQPCEAGQAHEAAVTQPRHVGQLQTLKAVQAATQRLKQRKQGRVVAAPALSIAIAGALVAAGEVTNAAAARLLALPGLATQ